MQPPNLNRNRILKHLSETPATRVELEKALGLAANIVSRWVKDLHKGPQKQIRIVKWKYASRNRRTPIYAEGSGPDAECTLAGPRTKAELDREYRKRIKRSGEIEEYDARRRELYWANKRAKRDPLTAALFGPGPNSS